MLKSFLLPFTSYKYLLYQLIQREIKARYKQSIIGYAWVILNPLLQLLVYSFVFSVVFRFPTSIPYPVFLFIGLLPWIYLQTVVANSTLALVDNRELLKKVAFPREVFIYSIVTAKLIDLFFASIVLGVFMIFYQVSISPSAFWIIPLLGIQIMLITGIGFIFSTANLFYRDIQYLANLVLMLWMYVSPVVYPLSMVPPEWIGIYKLNPMVGIIEGYRSALFGQSFDLGTIAWSFVFSLVIFVVGFITFKRSERVFADLV
jgi:ABC-type polysaccharide/polyol phosphate export permease